MPPELLLLPWMLLVLSCSLYREPWQQLLSCLVWSLSSGTVVPSELHAECFNLCLRQTYPLHLQSGGCCLFCNLPARSGFPRGLRVC